MSMDEHFWLRRLEGESEESILHSPKRTTMRTREDALDALELLASEFGIPVPALRWNERTRRGIAYCNKNAIGLGHLAWRRLENSLLHEFAHILAFRRYGPVGHKAPYMRALWDTVKAWHGDASEYAWATEYKSICAFGKKQGAFKAGHVCIHIS